MNSTATLKNRPVVGQTVRWIEPEEHEKNPNFIIQKKERYPGELKVLSVENRSSRTFITISHNGQPVLCDGRTAVIDTMWFHWEGE